MSTVEEIIVRYTAQDDLSGPTRRARGEVDALIRSLQQLSRTTVDPKVQLTGLAGASGQVAQQLQRQTTAQNAAGQSLGGLTRATYGYGSALSMTVRSGVQFTNWLGNEVVRGARDGVAAMSALGVAAAAMGLKAAGGFQMAQAAMSAITGSQALGTQLMNWTVQENLRTVFTQADIQRSLQTELALGVPVTAARPQLQAAENLTAATGNLGNLPDVVMALSKVTAGGHMTGREFNQLAANGVPIAQIISENTGMSTGDVVAAAHGGTLNVKAADFQQWLTSNSGATLGRLGANGGIAHVMNETLLGQASTAKDAALQALRGGIQPMLPQMTQGIEGFSKALNPFLAREAPVLGDIVLKLEHFFTSALPAAMPVVDAFFRGVDHVLGANYNGAALLQLGTRTGDSITHFFDAAAKSAPAFAGAFISLAGAAPTLIDDLTKFMPLLRDFAHIADGLASNSLVQQLVAGSMAVGLGAHAANAATGGVASNVMQYAMMSQLMRRGGGAGGIGTAAAGTAGAGRAARMLEVGGKALRIGGGLTLAAGGAYDMFHDFTSHDQASWMGAGKAALHGAEVGGGLGLMFGPEGGLIGAGVGAGVSSAAYGLKALFGGSHTTHTDNSLNVAPGAIQINGDYSPQHAKEVMDQLRAYAAEQQRRNGGGS